MKECRYKCNVKKANGRGGTFTCDYIVCMHYVFFKKHML